MTDMKRCTISLPDDLDEKITEYRRRSEKKITYSEAARRLLYAGADKLMPEPEKEVN